MELLQEVVYMTREEMKVSLRRFSKMYSYYRKMITSDPKNAQHYKILVDHYQLQYTAVGNSIQELDCNLVEGNAFA